MTSLKTRLVMGLFAISVCLGTGRSEASIIGGLTFDGDVYQLEDLGANLFRLTVDTDGSAPTNYLYAVAINLGGASSGASLNSELAPGTWTYVDGGLSAEGCNGSGAAFDCAQWSSGTKAFDDGSIYSWTWLITSPNIDPEEDHLKANYFGANGKKALQFSLDLEPVGDVDHVDNVDNVDNVDVVDTADNVDIVDETTIPEPATMLLVGLGAAGVVRRRLAMARR